MHAHPPEANAISGGPRHLHGWVCGGGGLGHARARALGKRERGRGVRRIRVQFSDGRQRWRRLLAAACASPSHGRLPRGPEPGPAARSPGTSSDLGRGTGERRMSVEQRVLGVSTARSFFRAGVRPYSPSGPLQRGHAARCSPCADVRTSIATVALAICAHKDPSGIGRPWAGPRGPMMSALDRGPVTSAALPWPYVGNLGTRRRAGGRYADRARPVRKARGNAGPPSLRAVTRLPLEGEPFEMRIRDAHLRGAFEGCCTRRRCARAKAALA